MKILFDLFTPQGFVGGAGEYIRKVFYTLLDEIKEQSCDVQLVALVDSSLGRFAYADLAPESLCEKGIEVADANGRKLSEILKQYQIDKVFVGAAQYWGGRFDVESLNCPVVCIVHDLMNEEFAVSQVNAALCLDSYFRFTKMRLGTYWHRLKNKNSETGRMKAIMQQAQRNDAFRLVTVSDYSRNSLSFHFSYPHDKVDVLFSPQRITNTHDEIENELLRDIVADGKKYYLMLSANRLAKNAKKALAAFKRFAETDGKDFYFVTVGYPQSLFPNHIVLPYLSESDLSAAMKNCYALLFPSVFEGFGYPPVEAMGYGKPVLASNVTSIPEVLSDAAIYFSPFYESDIFRALHVLNDDNYETYVQKSTKRAMEVAERQQQDLAKLVKMIME